MPYIVSKLSSGQDYAFYTKGANGKPIREGVISINGGAGVAHKKTLVTPLGVVTSVTAEELKKLRTNPVFKAHEAEGYVKALDKDPRDADKAAADMQRDASDQLTPGDYAAAGANPPQSGPAS